MVKTIEPIREYKKRFGKDSNNNFASFSKANYRDQNIRNVAVLVLEEFDIEYISPPPNGGTLEGIDIKHMDATSAIKMSLAESFGKDQSPFLLEPIVNELGVVEFVHIGRDESNFSQHVYHSIKAKNFEKKDVYVMITGRKPVPQRKISDWKNLLLPDPPPEGLSATIWDTQAMYSTCYMDRFRQYATITFHDPHFADWAWGDGIESIYDVLTPFEKVIGWVYYLDPGELQEHGGLVRDTTNIYYKKQCSVPILVSGNSDEEGTVVSALTHSNIDHPDNNKSPDIGTLIKRVRYPLIDNQLVDQACWTEFDGSEVDWDAGTAIEIPIESHIRRYENIRGTFVDKFVQVSKVYVVGPTINRLMSIPNDDKTALTNYGFTNPDNCSIWAFVSNTASDVTELVKGVHYVIGYKDDKIYIQFANNARSYDYANYGRHTSYKTYPGSAWFSKHPEGGRWTILPLENGTGLFVDQIFAVVDMDSPCLVISDPVGRKAHEIATEVEFEVAAITITDAPAPVALNGVLIDQADGIVDSDPTTIQDLSNTQMETVLSMMDEGGINVNITMSSLDEDEVVTLSSKLYDYIKNDEGIEVTYVCDPAAEPKLGDKGYNGGVINNITYSYTDGGSYTISVSEGPRVMSGMAGITGDRHIKADETVTAEGTVIQDAGNHVIYKVKVDGVGIRECISSVPEIIRVGDTVTVTIYNNPVEA